MSGFQLSLPGRQPRLTAGDPKTYVMTCAAPGVPGKVAVWGSIIMIIRLSTELNLSLGPPVQSFPVERFWALYNPLCLDGGKDNHGQVVL